MANKEIFHLEYILKTSPKVLEKMITTPDGLSEWLADDVNVKNDMYTFSWDGSEEEARLISRKAGEGIKLHWMHDEDEDEDTYVEMCYTIDPLTKAVIFRITDFAEPSELKTVQRMWESHVGDLRRVLGA